MTRNTSKSNQPITRNSKKNLSTKVRSPKIRKSGSMKDTFGKINNYVTVDVDLIDKPTLN